MGGGSSLTDKCARGLTHYCPKSLPITHFGIKRYQSIALGGAKESLVRGNKDNGTPLYKQLSSHSFERHAPVEHSLPHYQVLEHSA